MERVKFQSNILKHGGIESSVVLVN